MNNHTKPTAQADMRHFVHVEFSRSLVNIKPGEARHPWHWCIIVQNGHIYANSNGFHTLADAIKDLIFNGAEKALEAEVRLAESYCGPHQSPYDLSVTNSSDEKSPSH